MIISIGWLLVNDVKSEQVLTLRVGVALPDIEPTGAMMKEEVPAWLIEPHEQNLLCAQRPSFNK
jgi:hypothetical protein